MKRKSRASIFFLVIGIIMIIMALKVFEWGESLGTAPANIIQFVAMLVALLLLALGATGVYFSTYFKTMSGLATEENLYHQVDSNDDGKGAEDARNPSRGGKRLVKRIFVIVHLGVLAFFIAIVRHPILEFVIIIAGGALIWRAWKWERNERKIHGAEDPVQRHLRAQAKQRKR